MKLFQATLKFVEVIGTHSRANLSGIVFKIGMRYKILHKIISIIGDNASNNDTLYYHLYRKLESKYDYFLDSMPVHGDPPMRFQGEGKSQVQCFAHILNLVVEAILEDLGSSTHKGAVEFLNRAVQQAWV